jgi:hypothetical protein
MRKTGTIWLGLLAVFVTVSAGSSVGQAQQVTDTPGSPSATTTIDGKHLPPPDPKFGGVIEEKASQSKPWWPPRVKPQRRGFTLSFEVAVPTVCLEMKIE